MDSIHWVNVDLAGGVAQGVVGGVGITLTVGSNGLIDFYETNSTEFNASAFTPPLPVAEFIEFTGSPANPRYTLTFSQPVCDLTLHLYSLGSILTFSTTNITKVSGDSLLTVSNNVVTGDLYDTTGHDANGTIFWLGPTLPCGSPLIILRTTMALTFNFCSIPLRSPFSRPPLPTAASFNSPLLTSYGLTKSKPLPYCPPPIG
jgi:hypothetical protein